MHETVQRLLKIQELTITLQESRIVHGQGLNGVDADEMQLRIDELRQQISPEVLAKYDRLSRQGLAVVTLHHNMCLGCNIGIAKGDINRIAMGKLEPVCPHCGKFLIF